MSTSQFSENWSNVIPTCFFIDLYKERPYLKDPKPSDYKNKLIRFEELTEIVNIMKISVRNAIKN